MTPKLIGFVLIGLLATASASASASASEISRPWYRSNLNNYASGIAEIETQDGHMNRVGFLKSVSGKQSSKAGMSGTSLMQHIGVDKEWLGKRVRLSARVKTELSYGEANLFMSIEHGYGEKTSDNMAGREIQGETDWQTYAIVLDVSYEETAEVIFGLTMNGSGIVYFDDFNFEVVDYDVKTTGQRKYEPRSNKAKLLDFEAD